VVWVETDNTGTDSYGDHQVRACLRGRSIRRRINHPDRLNYPMKRVGKRGEGKFVRISWDRRWIRSPTAQTDRQRVWQRSGLH
jgi:Tat-targeted selenate reductase subunit YnfE